MKFLLPLLIASSLYAAPLPSPKGAEIFPVRSLVGTPVPQLAYWWDYPESMPVNDLVFEVWHSEDRINWTFMVEAVKPPVWITPDKSQEFFIVRARNQFLDVSEWNVK